MMHALRLAFDIRLTGLRSATHLNGREGVVRGQDPVDTKRWTALLDDGFASALRPQTSCTYVVGTTGECRRESISCDGGLAASGAIGALQLQHYHLGSSETNFVK